MKVALCFLISYNHILNKEEIWREWIESNKDIINVYFFYKNFFQIQSEWIRAHALPYSIIVGTSYYHVVPGYLALYKFAIQQDAKNQWFCMLTDSCCPIVSPTRFRHLFLKNSNKSLLSWKPAWWNTQFHRRGNLAKLPVHLRLGHDPWFVLSRPHLLKIFLTIEMQPAIVKTVCAGGLANESLFAILLKLCGELETEGVRCVSTHLSDWSRRVNPTSPHVFHEGNDLDYKFIKQELERNQEAMFVRKVAPEFPDSMLRYFIYEHRKEEEQSLTLFVICFVVLGIIITSFTASYFSNPFWF